jgi:transposase
MKMVLLAAGLRAMEDMTAGAAVVAAENYRELGVVTMSVIPSFNTLLREFANPKYMPWLHRMIAASAAPLIVLEDKFACDGTGFGSSVYDCHNDEKHGSSTQRRKPTKRHRWVHGHIAFGVRTHVIAAVQITEKNVAESPLMPELVQRVKENGGYIREWLADAAYMAAYNVEAVEKVGGTPYIDFPSRTRGAGSPVIRRLYNKFQADQDEYYRHYHQRSLAESGMNMIKTRFSHHLRSRVPNAMYAEAMLRCICHNIAMLVHAIGELGVEPRYYTAESSETLVATPAPKPAPASVTVEGAASP